MPTLPHRNSKAFTLLELIVVIVILGILAAIAIPTFQKVIEKSKDNSAKQTLQALDREAQALAAFDNVPADETHYAAAAEDLNAFQTGLVAAGTYTVATSETEAASGSKLGLKVSEGTAGVSLLSESGNCVTLRNAGGTVTLDVKKIAAGECTGATAWLETGTAAPSAGPVAEPAVTAAGVVATFAGTGSCAYADGTGTAAAFCYPRSMASVGSYVYLAEYGTNRIRRMDPATGEVTTLAGSGTAATVDGTGTGASFKAPIAVASDGTNLYVAEGAGATIRKVVIATAAVTTLAGSGTPAFADGTGTAASFNEPSGLHLSGNTLYVADTQNKRVRAVDVTSGAVTTFAGTGTSGYVDGPSTTATFFNPNNLAADGTYLYVSTYGNIRRIDLATKEVSTLAGTSTTGHADGIGSAAQFFSPQQIAFSGGNLYVSDMVNNRIRKVDVATGAVSTVAGSGTGSSTDGTGTAATFNGPVGMVVHGTDLFVSDNSGAKIRRVS